MTAPDREEKDTEARSKKPTGAHRTLFGSPTIAPPDTAADSQGVTPIVRLKKEDLFRGLGVEDRARYALSHEIGRGAMGAILKVFDNDLRRSLAMKVILGQGGTNPEDSTVTADTIDRFLAEAQITSQLEHPGIVPVHELGIDDDGRVYFTMRLVRGKDFSEVIQFARNEEKGWTMTRALGALLKICETVSYAHARGVVHRDLKPANVMVGRFGETYVMDWGTARLAGDETEAVAQEQHASVTLVKTDRQRLAAETGGSAATTQEGSIMGTPYYMPLEQAAGRLDEIGPHSDVYAVGSMLYELLTGRRPYENSDESGQTVYGVIAAIFEGPPAPPEEFAGKAPPELLAICEKAIAHDWHDRYANMLEMAEDLRAFLEGRVVKAYDTGTFARIAKWISRNRALSAALAGLILLAVIGITSTILLQNENLRKVRAEQQLTKQAQLFAEGEEKRAWKESYVANLVAANASLRSNETREAKRLLELAPENLRGWEWRHLSLRADTSTPPAMSAHSDRIASLVVDRAGTKFLSSSDDRSVRVWDAQTHEQLFALEEDAENVVAAAFATDGRRIHTLEGWSQKRLRTWSIDSGELEEAISLPATPTSTFALNAEGSVLAFATAGHELHLIDLRSGQPLFLLGVHEDKIRALAFDAAGERLFSGSEDGTVRVWSVESGQRLKTYGALDDPAVYALALHPTKPEFVTGTVDGVVHRWSMDGESFELFHHAETVQALAFGPSGEYLASAALDKTVEVRKLSNDRVVALSGNDEPVSHLSFVDASQLVAAGVDGVLRVWDLSGKQVVATFDGAQEPDSYVSSVAVSPDDRTVAFGSYYAGTLQVLDRSTGRILQEVTVPEEDAINSVAFNSTGTLIAAGHSVELVRIYDASDLSPVSELEGHLFSVKSVAFRSDGEVLASGSEDFSIKLWSLSTFEELQSLEPIESPVNALAFEANGTRLAAAFEDGSVLVLDSTTGDIVDRLAERLGGGATSLAWSPDGLLLAAGAGDNSVLLWDFENEPDHLRGHEQRITCLAFHPTESRLVSGSYDHSLRVWDTETRRLLLTLRGHEAWVTSVVFSPDGETVVSGSTDNTVRLWNTR